MELTFFISLSIIKGNQDRNSNRAGTWRQGLMQRPWSCALYFLVSHGLLSLLSYRIQNHKPRGVSTYNRLDLLLSVTNQKKKNPLWVCLPTVLSYRCIFLIDNSSPQMTPACAKLNKEERKDKTNIPVSPATCSSSLNMLSALKSWSGFTPLQPNFINFNNSDNKLWITLFHSPFFPNSHSQF